MFKANFQFRKPDPLALLAMVVGFSALLYTSAAAAETFFSQPKLDDLMDGDLTVARMGRHGPAMHMSFISPADMPHAETLDASDNRQASAMPEVYLSVRLPW